MINWNGIYLVAFLEHTTLIRSLRPCSYLYIYIKFLQSHQRIHVQTLSTYKGDSVRDPISPALFTIYFDLLSRFITRAESIGDIHGVKISQESPLISHLMFADDLLIFCRANTIEVKKVKRCLNVYCTWSGQSINYAKSIIHFSCNTSDEMKHEILHKLEMV